MPEKKHCPICKQEQDSPLVDVYHTAYNWVIKYIKSEHPRWVEKDGACPHCIEYYKKLYPKGE